MSAGTGQTFNIDNFGPLNLLQPTVLDADAASGSTSITVVNNEGYSSGQFVVLGNPGADGSEVVTAGSPAGATGLNVSATTLNHNRYEPINQLFGNQINLYRALNVDGLLPADDTFTLLATINIDTDQLQTSYTDSGGSSAYWYKFTYFNSTSSAETSLADSTAQRGGGFGHYVAVADVRDEAGMKNNVNIPDAEVDSFRIEAEERVEGELYNVYTLPFALPVPAPIVECVRQIAAGNVLLRDRGPMASGNKKQGTDKLGRGLANLEMIKSRQIILLDGNKNSLLIQPMVTSWPNATTDQTGSGLSDDQLATRNQDRGAKIRSSMVF